MITRIEALHYRCLKYINQPLEPFHVLVGPNASGKTTFLDVIAFLGRLVADGPEAAIGERTANFQDLVWGRSGDRFELAIEAQFPEKFRPLLPTENFDTIRYEIALGIDPDTTEVGILAEKALLKGAGRVQPPIRLLFPAPLVEPASLLTESKRLAKTVVNKVQGGNDFYYSEVYPTLGKGWTPSFMFGPRKSALGNLPADESKFPVANWLKSLLNDGVQQFILNSLAIRRASPPGQVRRFKPDGSNLPWVIHNLQSKAPERFQAWIAHVQTALPDIEDIRTEERKDDKHRYLIIQYRGGLEVPSWVASDGTLRLLALTLPAYLPDFSGVYLVEEPENGIHPRAVETVIQSLSSVYEAQILLATHSPVILSVTEARQVLCFAKTSDGATDIVSGSDHPALREWRGETNLSTLYAAGVLG